MDFFEDEFQPTKRSSFDENPLGDLDDMDDDFEFDRESRAVARSPSTSPKTRASRHAEARKKPFRTKAKKASKVPSRVRDLAYESGVERYGLSDDSFVLGLEWTDRSHYRSDGHSLLLFTTLQQREQSLLVS